MDTKTDDKSAGQCPVMHYHRDLMEAILWDRMPYLSKLLNVQVIGLEDAIEAYRIFDEGSPKKFVIDPHGVTKMATRLSS